LSCRPATRPAGVSLPSQEKMGVQPYEHYDGVGPLPGTSSETSVAKLPDERKAEERSGVALAAAAAAAAATADPLAQAGIANLGTQVRRFDDSRDTATAQNAPEREGQEADVKNVAADSKFKEEVASGPETKGERKVESIRSAEGRRSSEKEEGVKSVPPGESAAAAGVPAQRKQRSSSDSDASHHKRASVMNKVKGEMKVLLGKASRNKDKVEEGEKLKHGSD